LLAVEIPFRICSRRAPRSAVLPLDNPVVPVQQLAREIRPENAPRTVGNEDKADFQVAEAVPRLEEGRGGRGDGAPDRVDDCAEDEGTEDVFFEDEAQRLEEGWKGDLGGLFGAVVRVWFCPENGAGEGG
jgi:hypothetical protein